jgi:putative molybdopterin biosynthesis protein
VLTIFASHDLALPALRDIASQRHRLHIDLRFAGSVDALEALSAGRCLVAGFHVPSLQGRSPLFAQAMKPRLKPGLHKLIGCLRRAQGLMVARGNPLQLHDLSGVTRSRARFVNRQAGSGTRLLMDHLMQAEGLAADAIPGYLQEAENSHVAVAAAIASGSADVGPGIEAAARQFGLDFVPLVVEDYFLVCLKDALEHPAVLKLRQALDSPDWLRALERLPGYQPAAECGAVLSLTQALPWWHYRAPKAGSAASPQPASATLKT